MDTIETHHLTSDSLVLQGNMPYTCDSSVMFDNRSTISITHSGNASQSLTLIPQLEMNLIYVEQLCHGNSVYVEFLFDSFFIKDLTFRNTLLA